jgi:hypothetical protein
MEWPVLCSAADSADWSEGVPALTSEDRIALEQPARRWRYLPNGIGLSHFSLFRYFWAGLSDLASRRLEQGLSHQNCVASGFVTASGGEIRCRPGCDVA